MKMIFKGETGIYQLCENSSNLYEVTDNIKSINLTNFKLYKGQSYEVDEIDEHEIFKYKLDVNVPKPFYLSNRYFLLTDEEFKKYFRLPIKDHYQIKVFSTISECNEFLENLELDYLKDVKVTDSNVTVIYLVKGD